MAKQRNHLFGRIVVLILAVCLLGYACRVTFPVILVLSRVSSGEVDLDDVPYNDLTRLAFDVRREESQSQLSYNVILLGILWGLILVSKDAPTISFTSNDFPESVCFVIGNLMIVLNVGCYYLYTQAMSSLAVAGGKHPEPDGKLTIADFVAPEIDTFSSAQQTTLLCILILVGMLVVSTHRFKGQ